MEEVIRKYFQCWLNKDVDTVKGIFSEDIVYSECYGPIYKGIGQIIRWFEDWNRKGTVLQWDSYNRKKRCKKGLFFKKIFIHLDSKK